MSREPFQIHLSTALALMIAAGVVLWINLTPRHSSHYTTYGWPGYSYWTSDDGYSGVDWLGTCCCGIPLWGTALYGVWFTLEACIRSHMKTTRVILSVAISAVIFAIGGMVVGAFIAKYCPDYYRSSFNTHGGPPLDPMQMGVSLGLTEGGGVGVCIGVLAVLLEAWHRRIELRKNGTS